MTVVLSPIDHAWSRFTWSLHTLSWEIGDITSSWSDSCLRLTVFVSWAATSRILLWQQEYRHYNIKLACNRAFPRRGQSGRPSQGASGGGSQRGNRISSANFCIVFHSNCGSSFRYDDGTDDGRRDRRWQPTHIWRGPAGTSSRSCDLSWPLSIVHVT